MLEWMCWYNVKYESTREKSLKKEREQTQRDTREKSLKKEREQTQRDTMVRLWKSTSTHESPWRLHLYYISWPLQWDSYILDKLSLTRTRFTSITSNVSILGLSLMTQYISKTNNLTLFVVVCSGVPYVLLKINNKKHRKQWIQWW